MANRYSDDFIRRVKSLYPHDQVTISLAEENDRALVRRLEWGAQTSIENRTILNSKSLVYLQQLARLNEDRTALYVECCDILNTWKEPQKPSDVW